MSAPAAPPLPRPVRLFLWVLAAGVAAIAWTGYRIAEGARYRLAVAPNGTPVIFDAWHRELCTVQTCEAIPPAGARLAPRLVPGARYDEDAARRSEAGSP